MNNKYVDRYNKVQAFITLFFTAVGLLSAGGACLALALIIFDFSIHLWTLSIFILLGGTGLMAILKFSAVIIFSITMTICDLEYDREDLKFWW